MVSIQHFSTYWSRPPEEFQFGLNDNYNVVLARVSGQLGLPVDCLYTCDKLSRIKQTGVLVTKHRVIAAVEHARVKGESGTLGNITGLAMQISDRRTDVRTDRQADGRTDRQTNCFIF